MEHHTQLLHPGLYKNSGRYSMEVFSVQEKLFNHLHMPIILKASLMYSDDELFSIKSQCKCIIRHNLFY